MPGSLLLSVALSATVLLVPVALGLLRIHRPSHAAPRAAAMRRHVGLPAAAVGLGGAVCAGALGAGLPGAGVAGLVLASAVVVQAWRSATWLMLGVATWALLVTGTAAFLAWLALQVLDVGGMTATFGGGLAWLLLAVAVARVRPHARRAVARSARREPLPADEPATTPPVGWLVTGAASISLVLAFGVGAALAPDEQPSRAAEEDAPVGDRQGGPSTVTSPSASASPGRPSPTAGGTPGPGASRDEHSTPEPEPVTDPTGPQETPGDTASPEPTEPTKTPGYEKEKPNRPSDAPTPGSGRRGAS